MYYFARLLLLAAFLSIAPMSDCQSEGVTPRQDDEIAANTRVRLRKLHLVRPDLIPYPISFEVYC